MARASAYVLLALAARSLAEEPASRRQNCAAASSCPSSPHDETSLLQRSTSLQVRESMDHAKKESNFYFVKQSFKSDEDIKAYWEHADKLDSDSSKVEEAETDAGYDNHFQFPLAKAGPIFTLLEQKQGTKEDAQTFVDKWMNNVMGIEMDNEIMPLLFPPLLPITTRAIAAGRRIFYVNEVFLPKLQDATTSDVPKLMKMGPKFAASPPYDACNHDFAKAGFHGNMLLTTLEKTFEIFDAEPNVTASDIHSYMNKWTIKNVGKMDERPFKTFRIDEKLMGDTLGKDLMDFEPHW